MRNILKDIRVVFVILVFVIILSIWNNNIPQAGSDVNLVLNDYHDVVSKNTLDELLPYLSSQNVMKVKSTVWRIKTLSDSRVVGVLESLWNENDIPGVDVNWDVVSNPKVKLAVAEGLLYLNAYSVDEYVDYIFVYIVSNNSSIRAAAASALGSVGGYESVNELISLIKSDTILVSMNAVSSLKKIIIENRPGQSKAIDFFEDVISGDIKKVHPILVDEIKSAYALISADGFQVSHKVYEQINVDKDFKKGEELFFSGKHGLALEMLLPYAEQKGSAQAQYYLGEIYSVSIGVDVNYVEAVKWLRKAADQGHQQAQFSLANMYLLGKGVNKNFQRAIILLNNAAEHGHLNSQKMLKRAYQLGWWGLPKDLDKAKYWHERINK